MAFAVITDVHANWEALKVVLDDIKRQGITEIYCLGDIVGYGPNPRDCVNAVKKYCKHTTKGNHELGLDFIAAGKSVPMNSRSAIAAIKYSYKKLWSIQKEFLKKLPHEFRTKEYLFLHANPTGSLVENIFDYIIHPRNYDSCDGKTLENKLRLMDITNPFDEGKVNAALDTMRRQGTRICFTGHTHMAGSITGPKKEDYDYVLNILLASEPLQEHTPQTGTSFEMTLEEDKIYIINPGAVGQPRDRDNRTSYVIVDEKTVIWRRLPYDFEKTMRKVRSRIKGTEEEQILRLKYGKYRKEKEN